MFMNKLFIASLAGFFAAATSAISLYEWQMGIDIYQQAYVVGVITFALAALANVAYWYGFSIIGTKYHNRTLHTMEPLWAGTNDSRQ